MNFRRSIYLMVQEWQLLICILVVFAACKQEGNSSQKESINKSLSALEENSKFTFWDQQRKGANGDGGALEGCGNPEMWFQAARDAGIEYVRLAPNEWKGRDRDFLMGDADHFVQIVESDFQQLKEVLDIAEKNRMKIVLTMFQIPGARWRQLNNMQRDFRIWTDSSYQQQAIDFWTQLAGKLKDHPAIVGYNILNEPHPSWKDHPESSAKVGFEQWLTKIEGSTSDLNRFYRKVVASIRQLDPHTPIIIDGWQYASPEGFAYLEPIEDEAILYAFHFYGNWEYATYRVNKGRFSYPDKMPSLTEGQTEAWEADRIEQELQPIYTWAEKHKVPINRIIAEEFGVDRRVGGATQFLADVVATLNKRNMHWAFYSFRSCNWDGMDYELGTEKLKWVYWQKIEAGVSHEEAIQRRDNPIWAVLKKNLKSDQ